MGSIPAHPTKIQKTVCRDVSRFSFLDAEVVLKNSIYCAFTLDCIQSSEDFLTSSLYSSRAASTLANIDFAVSSTLLLPDVITRDVRNMGYQLWGSVLTY